MERKWLGSERFGASAGYVNDRGAIIREGIWGGGGGGGQERGAVSPFNVL